MDFHDWDAIHVLKNFVDGFKTKAEAASHLQISRQFLNDMLKGHRAVSSATLKKIGYRRKVEIVKEGE